MTTMVSFSPQQERAIKQVKDWLGSPSQVFRLFGFAGTGKTTLARHLDADYYAAYTGKAAHVLQQKGCPATTIHSLIYHAKEKSEQRLAELIALYEKDPSEELYREIKKEEKNLRSPSFVLNLESPLRDATLLIIDECSMVDQRMGEDLLSFGCKILVLGDPAQLPPIMGGGFFTEQKPDFLLTEVHRQAADNPVLDLATRIRMGEPWEDHELVVNEIDSDMVLAMDQIIVGRNATRHQVNDRIRELLGYKSAFPQPGEKVVCLRNNHFKNLLNGALYTVEEVRENTLYLDVGQITEVHPEPFLGQEIPYETRMDADAFDYGYALTCHKSQGSQWDAVGIIDESASFAESHRWLYTAVTRAAKHLWLWRR